jgi:glycosyltransferase involved in cell wall biosynthesis
MNHQADYPAATNTEANATRIFLEEIGESHLPKVAILLCTCQGQRYLAEQIESIAAQTYANWEIWASDDQSRDDTYAILKSYNAKWPAGRFSIRIGPAQGFAANFLSLTCDENINADYCAYSDQDDIWEACKLERAISWLKTVPAGIPALYCSRTRLVDADNREVGLSPLFTKQPSFANALVQNIGGGNTMVFNRAARALLREAGTHARVISHDWWAYMIISGCGGRVFYDNYATVRYRQHDANLIGSNTTPKDKIERIFQLLQGRFQLWNDINLAALSRLRDDLAPDNRLPLERFTLARRQSLLPRLIGLKRSGIYRQTLLGNIGLITAAILGKM